MAITRHNFLNRVAITVTAGLTPLQILRASPLQANKTLYYPPALSGLHGNHPGSFENAHQLGRDGVSFDFASLPVTAPKSLIWWWVPELAAWPLPLFS